MGKRLVGVRRLPDVAAITRVLASFNGRDVDRSRALCRSVWRERVRTLGLARVSREFHRSVMSTTRKAEGTAVGYNRKQGGGRSYFHITKRLRLGQRRWSSQNRV